MNAEQLNAIKERAAKATPGPWYRGESYEQMDPGYYVASEANGLIVLAEEEGILRDEDVQFIAHAREDVPALVTEVERLTTVKHRLNSEVELYRKLYEGAQIQLSESEAENARLRKALEFYANSRNYEPWRESDKDRTDAFNFVDLDGGDTAKEALEWASKNR